MKVVIHKFKRIENLELPIPCSIYGGNGMNKTTALQGISFVKTGKNIDGKEFEQVYDNRVDIHDCIADVSFFDAYGNEFRRIVSPIFQTNRAGVEELKIKRSTRCSKNGIDCNDFADEFSDFMQFGTDCFFAQKEDVQRSIFIDLLKSKMPNYDVKQSSLKLKELKKAQKTEVDEVKAKTAALKGVQDVKVSEIEPEIIAKNQEFLKLAAVDNSALLAEINKRNNEAMNAHALKTGGINTKITALEIEMQRYESQKANTENEINLLSRKVFTPEQITDTTNREFELSKIRAKFEALDYYENIEGYATDHFAKNPVLVENGEKIKAIQNREFVMPEVYDACPISGAFCETAKQYSFEAAKAIFKNEIGAEITAIKYENRAILQKEMNAANNEYLNCKSELERAEAQLEAVKQENARISERNTSLSASFEKTKDTDLRLLNEQLNRLTVQIRAAKTEILAKKFELENLPAPIFEQLPEAFEISDELKAAHEQFESENKSIIGQIAINENNAKTRAKYEAEIIGLQTSLFSIGEQIAVLSSEISDYFSNLKNVVKSEFSGAIEIDVELLEYVMSRDEYKDCFKITANGNVFPYECNGALKNNLKLQVLATFQRLLGYKGLTIMDNCESNTTDPIETCGLNCVLAFATNDSELTVK